MSPFTTLTITWWSKTFEPCAFSSLPHYCHISNKMDRAWKSSIELMGGDTPALWLWRKAVLLLLLQAAGYGYHSDNILSFVKFSPCQLNYLRMTMPGADGPWVTLTIYDGDPRQKSSLILYKTEKWWQYSSYYTHFNRYGMLRKCPLCFSLGFI